MTQAASLARPLSEEAAPACLRASASLSFILDFLSPLTLASGLHCLHNI